MVEHNKVVKSCLHLRDPQENVTLKLSIHLANPTLPLSQFLAQKSHQISPDLEVCRGNRVNRITFFKAIFLTSTRLIYNRYHRTRLHCTVAMEASCI